MKTLFLALAAIAFLASLNACVFVKHEEPPETVTTTTTSRHVSAPVLVPGTTTVERTTTY